MGAVQMESGLRQQCPECKGFGWVKDPGCHHMGCCPCDSVPCPECHEAGTVPATCDHCGEPATSMAPRSGQPLCDECARPREGGPLGGMGYGISYTEQLAEARRLK